MKKIVSLLFAVLLIIGAAASSAAETETSGTVDMPLMGMSIDLPEEILNAKGQIVTDGVFPFVDGVIYYAYWTYCAMTEEGLADLYEHPEKINDAPICNLFYLVSIGGGYSFSDFNAMISNTWNPLYATKVGEAGDAACYLYMEPADEEFAKSVDPDYSEDYRQLTALKDRLAAGITFFEPYDPLIGTKIEFTTKDLDGNAITSGELFAQNDITMLNVWATWCGYCINEFPELQQIHRELQEKGCGIVGLLNDTENSLETARQQIAENGVEYPMIWAPDNFEEIFSIRGYPTTYFIGRDGEILASPVVGAYVEEYRKTLDELLASKQ